MKPEWAEMRERGWRFEYCTETMSLGASHPGGEKKSLADFKQHCIDRLLCNQIGVTIAFLLNDDKGRSETELTSRVAELEAAVKEVVRTGSLGFVTSESSPGKYQVVAKFACLEDMQAFYASLAKLTAASEGKAE